MRILTAAYSPWPTVVIAVAYASVIVFTTVHHEPWRDEVVPLSIARESASLLDLWRNLRHEGHPILWYLCLRYSYFLFGSSTVLPVLSVATAIAAVVILLVQAPLPLWIKGLFAFGYLPIFEYSVVARGNSLAMLLLFGFCAAYMRRPRNGIVLALLLAGLANTTPLGFIVAGAAGAMIVIDAAFSGGRDPIRHRYLAGALYIAGLVHAVASNMPDRSVLPLELYHHDVSTILTALGRALVFPAEHSAPFLWIPLSSLWLWLFFLLLLRTPALLAFVVTSLVGFELMFTLVYPASTRHMGYVLLVVVAALWLWDPWRRVPEPSERRTSARETWARYPLVAALTVALCFQVVLGAGYVVDDVQLDYSSAKRLAEIIERDPRLDGAIVIGEPEPLTQSLRYYRTNPIFLPEENTFRDWLHIQIPGGRRHEYSLAELLATATDLRDRYGVPVIMALGWWLDGGDVQRAYEGTYMEQTFVLSAESRTEFFARARFLGRLRNASFTDENYDVFVLW